MEVVELTPAPDAWQVVQKLAGLPHMLFLDSADHESTSKLNRYSFVAADPFLWLSGRSDNVQPPSFSQLTDLLKRFQLPSHPSLPPFQGGLAGLFGYELAHLSERLPRPRFDEFRMPELGIGLYDWVIAFDHREERA